MTVEHVEFKVSVASGNVALCDDPRDQIVTMLEWIKSRIGDGDTCGHCRDHNGNTVGTWRLTVTEEEE